MPKKMSPINNKRKAVITLIWLLSGVIIFAWLLMTYASMLAFLFALVFFGVPVFVAKKVLRENPHEV